MIYATLLNNYAFFVLDGVTEQDIQDEIDNVLVSMQLERMLIENGVQIPEKE